MNDWRWSLDVNVMGVINGINAFVPTLVAQDEGHVVNSTSSNGGFTPLVNSAIYATTKAAVTTLTECLWGQLRQIESKVGASCSTLRPEHRACSTPASGGQEPIGRRSTTGPVPLQRRAARVECFSERAKAAGMEVEFAPLERSPTSALRESGTTLSGSRCQARAVRKDHGPSHLPDEQTAPEYLLASVANVMTGRAGGKS